jgi:hypothetical protein
MSLRMGQKGTLSARPISEPRLKRDVKGEVMNPLSRSALAAGVIGVLAGIGAPVFAQGPGMSLKPGGNYAIGFQDGMVPGGVTPNTAPNGAQKSVTVYRVISGTSDLQWYRMRVVARNPAGGWYTPPGSPEVWVNMNYVMWVQEVLR